MENIIELCCIVILMLIMVSGVAWGYFSEKKIWDNGYCSKCGNPSYCTDKNSNKVLDADLLVAIHEKIIPVIEKAEKEARINELKKHITTLKCIIDTDKTPAYGYNKKERDKNNRGQFSYTGRWKTPREYCNDELRVLEQALSSLEQEVK